MEWTLVDVAMRIAAGVGVYLLVGVALTPIPLRMNNWDRRTYWKLSPDFSRTTRGVFALFWPLLIPIGLVAIGYFAAKGIFRLAGWLSEQVYPGGGEG